MADSNIFHLVVASVGESFFDGAALSATIPTTNGEITVLPHHEPLVTALKKGTIKIKESLGEKSIAIEGGVLEISGNRAVALL